MHSVASWAVIHSRGQRSNDESDSAGVVAETIRKKLSIAMDESLASQWVDDRGELEPFFLTRLVVEKGYYYTFYSLFFLGLVMLALIVPHGLFERRWFYLSCLVLEAFGIYFLVSSGWYWIVTNRIITH
jgi:hypothetical protein